MTIWFLGGPLHGMTKDVPDDPRRATYELSPDSWPANRPQPKLVYVRAEHPEAYELPNGAVPFLWDHWLETANAGR